MNHQWYLDQLQLLQKQDQYRSMPLLLSPISRKVRIGTDEKIAFCSNNYLALAQHPHIIQAVQKGLKDWGFGPGGSRLICGNTAPHENLQLRLAKLLGKQSCLIFPSGYAANIAVLSTLPQSDDLIAIDKLVHASIIDGARASAATVRTWPHKNLDKLKHLLKRTQYKRAFIVTDSLFSMDGDRADLRQLAELKHQFNAFLIVDEAHAFGCIGPDGAGCAAELAVLDDIDIFIATFSKALGGSGGFVACSGALTDYLINKARNFIFTTAIPAVNCLAAAAALDVIAEEPKRRRQLQNNAKYLHQKCQQLNLNTASSDSYIVPVILGSAEKALKTAQTLFQNGFIVPAVRPPAVPPDSSRLRLSLTSEHTQADIDSLFNALANIPAAK